MIWSVNVSKQYCLQMSENVASISKGSDLSIPILLEPLFVWQKKKKKKKASSLLQAKIQTYYKHKCMCQNSRGLSAMIDIWRKSLGELAEILWQSQPRWGCEFEQISIYYCIINDKSLSQKFKYVRPFVAFKKPIY